jgi:hypothetical protein
MEQRTARGLPDVRAGTGLTGSRRHLHRALSRLAAGNSNTRVIDETTTRVLDAAVAASGM